MLSDQLKESTRTVHQLLEKKLITSIEAIYTRQDYSALLSFFYSFFGGMEMSIKDHINFDVLPDYKQRRKIVMLAEDLKALEAKLPEMASEDEIPVVSNHLQAIGALYVMEGSTLGGKIISKIIRQQLALPEGFAMSFFESYGANTNAMWNTFKMAIDQPLQTKDEEIIIQSANETFIRFHQWFEQHS